MSKFQIITLVVFVAFIIAGVAAFALFKGTSSGTQLPPIAIWGTFPSDTFNQYVSNINLTLPQALSIKYTQEDPAKFSQDFIAALARGQGPDAILIPSDMLLPHMDKITPIPYSALPQRTFLDTYIDEGSMYLSQNGVLALPFTVNPLIMYWNRDAFAAAGIATYPHYWDEFTGLNQKLTVKDQNGNVRKSAVALGTFVNIADAREIFATLLLQLGNPITQSANGAITNTLASGSSMSTTPALQFFTQFVDPSNSNYSWNRSLPDSKSAFLSGMAATYFGFASELSDIRAKNPNLNFDAAPIPQVRTGGVKATYGQMYGFSIVRASPYANAVYQVISTLTSPQYLPDLSKTLYLPTVRRDIIAQGSADPYISIFDDAALVSKSWFDVDPSVSRQIFGNMVDSYTSGQKTSADAIREASDQYDVLLQQVTQ